MIRIRAGYRSVGPSQDNSFRILSESFPNPFRILSFQMSAPIPFVPSEVCCADEYETMKTLAKDIGRAIHSNELTETTRWICLTALDAMKIYMKKHKDAGHDLAGTILAIKCDLIERALREENGEVFTD